MSQMVQVWTVASPASGTLKMRTSCEAYGRIFAECVSSGLLSEDETNELRASLPEYASVEEFHAGIREIRGRR
jgi:hypothetical protein